MIRAIDQYYDLTDRVRYHARPRRVFLLLQLSNVHGALSAQSSS